MKYCCYSRIRDKNFNSTFIKLAVPCPKFKSPMSRYFLPPTIPPHRLEQEIKKNFIPKSDKLKKSKFRRDNVEKREMSIIIKKKMR